MTRDDIIRMAREAGLGTALCHNSIDGDRIWIEGADWHEEVERFFALSYAAGAADEREACAEVCESLAGSMWVTREASLECSDAIRARGQA